MLSGDDRRVLLVYDGDRPSGDLLDAVHRLGVWGTFDVRGDPRVLADQVRTALEGRRWAQDLASMRWMRALEANRSTLTPREREIVEELFSTPTTTVEDVAAQLKLSPNTVRVHIANVRRKLQGRHTGNRAALRDALVELGWLD